MWLMLQQDEPDDFVIATGEQHSVREFTRAAFAEVGIEVEFVGDGADEVGRVAAVDPDLLSLASNGLVESDRLAGLVPGTVVVRVDARYFRPTEVDTLLGDSSKARERLGWLPSIGFEQLVHDMVWADVEQAQRLSVLRAGGYTVLEPRE